MRRLSTKPNVIAPDSDFPYGRIKDKHAPTAGSKVNEQMWGDIIQFFEKMFDLSSIVANGLPDNAYTGFQLVDALINRIQFYVAGEATIRAAADSAESAARVAADSSEATARAMADATLQANINAKAAIAQAAWTNLVLINGWVSGGVTPQYFKDNFGCVHFRGNINGASNSAVVFAVLPAGSRPTTLIHKLINYATGNYTYFNMDAAGNVDATDGSGSLGTYSLDDINVWTI